MIAVPAALRIDTTLGLLKHMLQNGHQSGDKADDEKKEADSTPKDCVSRRTRLVGDARKRDTERDQREEEQRGGEDVEVAACHECSSFLPKCTSGVEENEIHANLAP